MECDHAVTLRVCLRHPSLIVLFSFHRRPGDGDVRAAHLGGAREGATVTSWFDVRRRSLPRPGERAPPCRPVRACGSRTRTGRAAAVPRRPTAVSLRQEWLENPPRGPWCRRLRRPRTGRALAGLAARVAARQGGGAGSPHRNTGRPGDLGGDPVLAVMRATGYSRRKSLRLIGQARDEGLSAPRTRTVLKRRRRPRHSIPRIREISLVSLGDHVVGHLLDLHRCCPAHSHVRGHGDRTLVVSDHQLHCGKSRRTPCPSPRATSPTGPRSPSPASRRGRARRRTPLATGSSFSPSSP